MQRGGLYPSVRKEGCRELKCGAVYAPTHEVERRRFFQRIRPKVPDLDVFAGDVNCVEDPADKSGTWRPTPSVRELAALLDDAGLVDSLPAGSTHTWTGHNCSARIDRVYGREDSDIVVSTQSLSSSYGLSDHRGLLVEITGADVYGGKGGFWRAQESSLDSRALTGRL